MDAEQQIRLNFLGEAEEYLDLMESNLLGLGDAAVAADKVDLILRSAHSVKGGAAMMGFGILSGIAHRLEDFFKILRVRYVGQEIDTEIETLLLQSVDCLRHIHHSHCQELPISESEIELRSQPLLDRLQEHLGNLEQADENALLAQDEDFDPAVLIFEEGVEGVLERFETQRSQLSLTELAQELSATTQELIGFGNMAGLEAFIQLCESIQAEIDRVSPTEIASLADSALKTWKRSHALVLRGSLDKLPSQIDSQGAKAIADNAAIDVDGLQSAFAETETEDDNFLDLSGLESAFAEVTTVIEEVETADDSSLDLSGLQSAFEEVTTVIEEVETADDSSLDLSGLQSAFAEATPVAEEIETAKLESTSRPKPAVEKAEKMVRVPASQLKQFNTLFEQLVLNRNSINLRLEQLQKVVTLMSQRMAQMENFNGRLKQWYDRASVEGLLSDREPSAVGSEILPSDTVGYNSEENFQSRFDSLEMDNYSEIHLICQEQIETIVQLQEVAQDIELGVGEVHQSVRDLYYTTKSMRGNVNRTQMLPFADAVKRLPRIIRELNLQYDKKVHLKISGENTLLDRSVIDALGDPLMHLLRNSFDHGIEEPAQRLERGKPELGTISIQARNQGTYSIITLQDDGGGIDLQKIGDRVCQMGLSPEEVAQIPEAELLNFIFEPGFSTAAKVTELSGRGVGMDVVKTKLTEVRGEVRVDTIPGQGTTFTFKIPFSLSILRAAIVQQGDLVFAIPADNIRELIASPPETMLNPENKRFIWNLIEIPLLEIDKVLLYRRGDRGISLTGTPVINQTMTLVVGDGTSFRALKIDRFWDEQEFTVRTIDSPIPLPPGVVSSVILGDGKVIPSIDPLALPLETDSQEDQSDRSNLNGDLGININVSHAQTILIVDDSINVRRYLGLTLEKAGYLVEEAKDGREAVDKLLGGLKVQGVICDLEMPRLDGYGVLEEIKERAEFVDLPIAMLTSRSNPKHRKLALNLGASAYFSKPYNERELLAELSQMLS